jgi:uncharacterized membrane protein
MHVHDLLRRLGDAALGAATIGVAATMYGISCFLQGDFASFWQPVPESLPLRSWFAFLSAGLHILAGLGLLAARTVRPSAALIMMLFVLFTVCYVIVLAGPPVQPNALMGIAENLSVAVGGWAILLGMSNGGQSGPIIARVTFGACSLIFGLAHFIGRVPTASMVPEWMPGGQMFWALATGVGHIAVGFGLIANRFAVPATRLGALMYCCFVLFAWLPGAFANPTEWLRWAGASISLCMAGALWTVGDLLAARKRQSRSSAQGSGDVGGEAVAAN